MQSVWTNYVKKALAQASGELRAVPIPLLNAVYDGALPDHIVVELPLLPPGLNSKAIIRSLIQSELLRRRQADEWTKVALATSAAVAAALVTATFAVLD